ncbi:MAG: hypothetical protein NVSMB46_09580 [Candidatus Saccharimonadales bacterium]
MLLDESYFTVPLDIAQLGQKAVVDKIKDFISKYEPLVLEAALGYDFYQSFKIQIAVTEAGGVIDQRWSDMMNGLVFTNINSMHRRFSGFRNCLAGFIYYEYMKDMSSSSTGIGFVKDRSENSVGANPVQKPINAFNESASQVKMFWEMLQADQAKVIKVYPEFDPQQVIGYYYNNTYSWTSWGSYTGNELYSFMTKNPYGI